MIERAVTQSFRPEFLNRLDRVVVFHPLERRSMHALVEKELRQMLARRGFRIRPWAVEWDEAAIDFLVERRFSPELGARPLRRAIDKDLLTQLALAIVGHRRREATSFSSSAPSETAYACVSSIPTPTVPSRAQTTTMANGRWSASR